MDKKILSKIKKCLALAKSSNANEAANAMRQAQKLMDQHGITDSDVRLSDVESAATKATATKSPGRHIHYLVSMVSRAFGVEPVFEASGMFGRWESAVRFIGVGSHPELAAYAFDVLRRQLEKDRRAYRASLKRMKETTKTRRADLFAEAWVYAVASKVQTLSVSDESKALVERWKETHYSGPLEDAKPREHRFQRRDYGAADAGHDAGRKAQLHHGVAGTDRAAIGHGG